MRTVQQAAVVLAVALCLSVCLCAVQVDSAPEDWHGLLQRTKRSLLWRWNSMKPVGAGCRDHSECGTKFCRKNICSFWNAT